MTFSELRLIEPIVQAVAAEGYDAPTPVQARAIPDIIAGRDLLGCARTGTGKTGAFALPILHRLAGAVGSTPARTSSLRNGNGRPRRRSQGGGSAAAGRPRALVLSPTRELASQIHESFNAYGRNLPLRHVVIFGGVSQHRQVRQLRDGVDVLVATPGRLLDLIEQGLIDLGGVESFVLDEADRMLDMGFIRDIRKIAEHLPSRRQTLLFSATMPAEIRRLADAMLTDPVFVKTSPVASPAEAIAQSVYHVARKDKPVLLENLLHRGKEMARTLVFTRTKHGADKLVKRLRRSGIEADAIHGNKNQAARTRALAGFKSGHTPVLVATDIASRGIDVDEITHVINFDIPNTPETYVHRIGRTARAGASGVAFSFCDHEEMGDLRAIERLIGRALDIAARSEPAAVDGQLNDEPAPHRSTHRRTSPMPSTSERGASTSRRRRGRVHGASRRGARKRSTR